MTHKRLTHKCLFCWIILLSWLTLPATWATAIEKTEKTFTLEKSIAYGLIHSPLLQGGAIRIDQAEMQIKSERGRFLPSVSGGYSYAAINNLSASGPSDADYIDQTQGTANLRISQALFTGFEYANRFKRAKLGKEYEKARLAVQQLDIALEISEAFFELLKTRQDIVFISKTIQRLRSDLAAAEAFADKQVAPYVHVLQAEADLEDAKQQIWQTQTTEKRLNLKLKRLLGMNSYSGIALEEIIFDGRFDIPDFNKIKELPLYITHALNNRPGIELIRLQSQMTKKDIRITRAGYYPRVSLDVDLYDFDKRYDNFPQSDQQNRYWKAGVNVQWKLFDGGTAYYTEKRQQLEIQRLKTDMKQITLEIKEEVTAVFNTLMENKNRLDSVERNLAAGQENYDREKTRLMARIGTTSRVLEAQARLARAEARKNQALLDCWLSLAQLSHAVGSMPL